MPNWYQSKLEAKHPLAIANALNFKLVKNKEKPWKIILQDFLHVLKQFQDGGFYVNSLDEKVAIRLGSLLGDGLAMFEILGLSPSFGEHSSRVCFRCEIGGGKALESIHEATTFVRNREKVLSELQQIAVASRIATRPNQVTQEALRRKFRITFRCPFFVLDYVSQ